MVVAMKDNNELRLQVKLEDEDAEAQDKHPHCSHGPTVLFYKKSPNVDGYYACAANRNRKYCRFRLLAKNWNGNAYKQKSVEYHYPETSIKGDVSDPTTYLTALSNDEAHAQYFFDEKALSFFGEQIRIFNISKVICIGAPRLHFYLRKMTKVRSFLLDIDERLAVYLTPQEFCLYNMCNNYFFYKREPFEQFLQCSNPESVLIVTDPPFACRTELIANCLRSITRLHNRINQLPHTPLAIFWVYPYYTANWISQAMPQFQMCDYKINYTNHERFKNVGGRSYGSPVRVFTNVPLEILQLPCDEGYRYCSKCLRYVAIENLHCNRCETCPSQNGQTYRHCKYCGLCVKPNYLHCNNCRRCTQVEGHNCNVYQSNQQCRLCRERGHIETKCNVWRKSKHKIKPNNGGCLICSRFGHTELKCKQRHKYVCDIKFMNQTVTLLR